MAEFTWGQLFLATHAVAERRGQRAVAMLRDAGIKIPNDSQDDPFPGPPIDDWKMPIVDRIAIKRELDRILGATSGTGDEPVRKVASSSNLIKLKVPYISQRGATARVHLTDCGPSCLAMIINAVPVRNGKRTVDELYRRYLKEQIDKPKELASFADLIEICQAEMLTADFSFSRSREKAWSDLEKLIRAGRPFIVLVKYGFFKEASRIQRFKGAHFILVTGLDDEHVYIHDPLFKEGTPNPGEYYPLSHAEFLNGWGGFGPGEGATNFSRLATDKVVDRLRA